MKKTKKLVVFLMTFAMVIALGTMASAKATIKYYPDKYRLNRIFTMYNGEGSDVWILFGEKDNVKFSVTNSNKKVAMVHVAKNLKGKEKEASLSVTPKAPGKTTVTVKYIVNGKTYKKVLKYNFAAYENPFSSFKIDGKEMASQFNKLKKSEYFGDGYWDFTGKITAGKLSYKLKSRYKVVNFSASRNEDADNDGEEEYRNLKITNNFELKKGDFVFIRYKDLKTNTYGYLWFDVK
ncbi:MAG: hypothetical protein ACI4EI_00545 [Muricoprocola sp.]